MRARKPNKQARHQHNGTRQPRQTAHQPYRPCPLQASSPVPSGLRKAQKHTPTTRTAPGTGTNSQLQQRPSKQQVNQATKQPTKPHATTPNEANSHLSHVSGSLVHHEHGRLSKQGPSHAHQLPLSHAEVPPALVYGRVQSSRTSDRVFHASLA